MNKNDSVIAGNSLAKKIAQVMQQVKYIQKTGYNSFHKYKYATEADVNEKIREELAKLNVVMMPSMEGHSIREHQNRSGNIEYIVCVDMTFTFIDGDTGETFTIKMSGEGQDAGDKGIYKAISGAQKYALMKAFMIPTGDDPEADETVDERNHGNKSSKNKPVEQAIDEIKVKAIKGLCERKGSTEESVLKYYKVNSWEEMTPEVYQKAMTALNKKPDKAV